MSPESPEQQKLMQDLTDLYKTFQQTYENKLSETQRIYEELHQYLRNQLDYVLKSVSDGVVAVGLDGKITAFNNAAEDLLGFRAENVVGEDYCGVFENLPVAGELLKGVLQSKKRLPHREVEWHNGNGVRHVLSVGASPIRDKADEVVGAVETFTDLTELKLLEEHLERKNRLEALGEMAAGVAHEIRNPLGAIELYASLLKRKDNLDDSQTEVLDKILVAVSGLNRIVEDMLAFTRSVTLRVAPAKIGPLIAAAACMAQPGITEKEISVDAKILKDEEEDFAVNVDAEMIQRVFLNLLLNAIDAVSKNGRIKISVEKKMVENRPFAKVSVIDNGCGIDESLRDKIFNPFFTGKRKGTGLGLPIAHRTVEAHGGKIEFESTVGQGTTFEVWLPCCEDN